MSDREMLASAVVTVARDKLVAALGDPAVTNTMRENLVSELEETKDEMESILVVLRDAERRSIREGPVRLWLQRLQRAAYDVWDMVDEIRTNKDAAPMASRMLPLSRANKISSVRQALHKICKEQFLFNFSQHFDVQNRSCYDIRRATSPILPEARVVGRDEQVERILDFLLSPAAGMSDDGIREWPVFLPIFGLAGVGKTTLAQLVYNHPRWLGYCDYRAWVYVSPSFDLKRIGRSIIELLDVQDSIHVLDDLDSITRRIHELVGDGKKVLLVLDDIWEQDQQQLDRLKSLLGVGTHGSSKAIVIVTTCDEDIARRICTNKVQPYKVHPLSDDQCWAVIKQASRFECKNDQQELGKIGREIIATKCEGLPLAAAALGYRLQSCDSYERWLQIASTDYNKLKALEFFINYGALSLNYESMPPNLRLCFAYLGTLPERQNMAEDDIIHRWIALGLIEPTNGISTGQQIISRLLDISFLEHSNLASTSRKHDDKGMISFSMHSLIHDFARSLMSSTLVVEHGEHTRDLGRRRCRCAVLTSFDLVPSKLSGMLPAELRSLSLLGCSKMELSNDSFSFAKLKYLQVLELREPSLQKLPDSICQLGLLGYLNLSGCSGLKNLPKSIGNLASLVYVNLSGCHGLDDLPKSFSKLNKLEHLDLSFCSCLRGLPTALCGLTNLRHLNLSHTCCDAVEHKDYLERVNEVRAKVNKLQYPNCHNTSAEEGSSRKIAIPKLEGELASAVVKVAHDMLASVLGDAGVTIRHGKLVPVLEQMKDMMGIIAACLSDTMRWSMRDEAVRLWLKRLENVTYDIWDMVAEIQNNNGAAKMATVLHGSVVAPRATKINKQVIERLRKVIEEMFDKVVERLTPQQSFGLQETSSLANMDLVVGRDEETHRILHILLDSRDAREEAVILPIFGLTGVGKTALAQLVYNHNISQSHYDAMVWVYVSPDFDLKRIGKSIIQGLRQERYDVDGPNHMQFIMQYLDDLLYHRTRVLIVLDGIWENNEEELYSLKHLLKIHGSKMHVLVTTHDEDIARRICTSNVKPYKLHPLSDDVCWQIIKQTSRFEARDDKQELHNIGLEIATKCGGLPLAAKALGYKLTDMNVEGWSKVRSTHDFSGLIGGFLSSVSLSYKFMPPTEKLCFAYLAILPDPHNMAKDDIIHRWIALGLIKPYDGTSTRYQRGEYIISRLLDISFLQHANLASTSGEHDDEHVILFTMHGLIHSFARSVMSSMLIIADGVCKRDLERARDCRCAVLSNFSLESSSKLSGILPAELWSLSLLGCSKIKLNDDSFSFAKYLRVLELKDPSIQELPGSICQLVLLGYLNLSGCSGLKNLPKSFGNLTNVVHINLSGCHALDDLPKSFSKLNKLEHLDLSYCCCLRELPTALCGLTNLRHLNLSHPCCDAVQHKDYLERVNEVRAKVKKLQYPNCRNTRAKEDLSRKIAIPELEGELASAIVNVTLDMLVSVPADAAVTIRHKELVPLEQMKGMMGKVAACLSYTKRSRMEEVVQLWLKLLENVAYDIWDMMAEMQNNNGAAQMATVLHCSVVGPRVTRINKVIERLGKIQKMFDKVRERLILFGVEQQPPSFGLQETSSLANMDLVVGRDEETLRILDILLNSQGEREEAAILPIFGLAGVGKTALAQLVYNHNISQRHYDARVWVYVSPDFDLKRIGNSIIQGLQQERYDVVASKDLYLVLECLIELLHRSHMRVLVVLDDIWERNQDKLAKLMVVLKRGSKVHVLVTTRDEDIAKKIYTVEPYKLHPLSDDLCWQIMKQTSCFEARDDKQELDKIGLEIAAKCGGLPLAAQALGYKLTGRGIEGRSRVRSTEDLFDVYFGDGFSERNNRFFSSVSLSYKLMPSTERLCFAYLATLPDRHNMAKDDIIYSWIALVGLMEQQRSESIIQRLSDISFLQDANLASVSTRSLRAVHVREKERLLTMNNVVHDLARYVLGERLVVVDGRNTATSSSSYVNSRRSGLFAFVSNLNATLENLSSILPGAGRILSLRFVGCSNIKISDGAFSSAKKLRLLDLKGCLDNHFLDNAYWPDRGTPPPTKQPLRRCSLGKLPESIGQLKNLRYLNAPAIQDRVLPLSIINGLSRCLRYLSLRCSHQLSDLTEAFGSMESLEYLDLSGCSGLKSLPKSFGACWLSLQHLDLSGCTGLKTLPQSVRRVGSSNSKLRHLDLSGCSCLEGITEALSGCTDLTYLNLSHRCGHSVEDWFHLKGLDDVLPTLKELQFLGISSCLDPFCYAMPAEESSKYVNCIASLDYLEHLDLSQNKFLRHLPENMGALRMLCTLDLSMCFKLESLQGIGEVNRLRVLDISGCPQLNPLPEDTQQQLAKLRFLESREWLTSITGPRQASGSQEERSLIVGGNQAQDWASTSQDAAHQPRMDPSSSEPEITEIPENH